MRYKENIQDLQFDKDAFLDLNPRKFNWISDGTEDIGFVAEEVLDIMPELVFFNSEGQPEGVRYDQIPTYMYAIVKDQQIQLDEVANAFTIDEDGNVTA